MTSKIRVELDFDKGEPYIRIDLDKNSEDLRDRTLQAFTEQANSNGIKFTYAKNNEHNDKIEIRVADEKAKISIQDWISKIDHEIRTFANPSTRDKAEEYGIKINEFINWLASIKHLPIQN